MKISWRTSVEEMFLRVERRDVTQGQHSSRRVASIPKRVALAFGPLGSGISRVGGPGAGHGRGEDVAVLQQRAVLPDAGYAPLMSGKWQPEERTKPMFMEHETNAFVREGDWKLVGIGVAKPKGLDNAKWELYNLHDDGTEVHDLAASNPDRVARMAAEWKVWADRVQVYPKPMPKGQGKKKVESDSESD
jgi:hypothetical protein